jgi:hypothetical protein
MKQRINKAKVAAVTQLMNVESHQNECIDERGQRRISREEKTVQTQTQSQTQSQTQTHASLCELDNESESESNSESENESESESENKSKSESSSNELEFLPEVDHLLFQILESWDKSLDTLWHDKLPQETLIAAALDPRFKQLHFLEANERNEAFSELHKEYTSMKASMPKPNSPLAGSGEIDRHDVMSLFKCVGPSQPNPKDEFNHYTSDIPQVPIMTNPLHWWKQNESTFPTLAEVAKKFLAIPASQASTERAFSTSGNIITKKRTRMSSEILEMLVLFHKNQSFFEFLCSDQ